MKNGHIARLVALENENLAMKEAIRQMVDHLRYGAKGSYESPIADICKLADFLEGVPK